MMRYLVAVALSTIAFCASDAFAQERREVPGARVFGQPASTADRVAVDALISNYKLAWGSQNTDALIELHADDVEWINAYARMFRGADALRDFLEHRLFPAFDAAVSKQEAANMKDISIRYLGEDAAVVHLYTDGQRGESRKEGETMRRTHLHLVLERQAPDWKIVHTAIMDAR